MIFNVKENISTSNGLGGLVKLFFWVLSIFQKTVEYTLFLYTILYVNIICSYLTLYVYILLIQLFLGHAFLLTLVLHDIYSHKKLLALSRKWGPGTIVTWPFKAIKTLESVFHYLVCSSFSCRFSWLASLQCLM